MARRLTLDQVELEDGSFLKDGEQFKVTAEKGLFVFRGLTLMFDDDVDWPKEEYVSGYGGLGQFVKWRAFTIDRIRVKRPRTRELKIKGVVAPTKPVMDPTVPVWDAPAHEVAEQAAKRREARANRKKAVGGNLRVYVESGVLPAGTVLSHDDHRATVVADGTVEMNGEVFTSLSAAGKTATGHKACAGWDFWFLPDGKPVGSVRGQ